MIPRTRDGIPRREIEYFLFLRFTKQAANRPPFYSQIMLQKELVVVLDFGAQYTQLIARNVRECGVYAEIYPFNIPAEKLRALNPKGIILSGGPSSVDAPDAPHAEKEILEMGVPILGICYGLQFIAWAMGGAVDRAAKKEFGRAQLRIVKDNASSSEIRRSDVFRLDEPR